MKAEEALKTESELYQKVLAAVKAKEYLVKNYLERQDETQYLLSYKDGKKHFITDIMADFTSELSARIKQLEALNEAKTIELRKQSIPMHIIN